MVLRMVFCQIHATQISLKYHIIRFTMKTADADVWFQLAEVWKLIEPTITKCLPEKLASGSNGG